MMQKLYINISNLLRVKPTGIQRVEVNIIREMLEKNKFDVELIRYDYSKGIFNIIDNNLFLDKYKDQKQIKKINYTKEIKIDEMLPNSLYLNLENTWNSLEMTSVILPKLKNRSIKVVTYIYDFIPILFPEDFSEEILMKFSNYIISVMTYSDLILTSTQVVKDDLLEYFEKLKIEEKPVVVTNLGCDFISKEINKINNNDIKSLEEKKYILIVSALKPIKNHELLLRAFDKKLFEDDINLVIVGVPGPNYESISDKIRNNKEYDRKLLWLKNISDEELSYLYKNAYFVASVSKIEGYGLPIVEAILSNAPVIAGNIPVSREVGKEYIDYVDVDNEDELIEKVEYYLNNPDKYEEKKNNLKNFKVVTWKSVANKIMEELDKFEESKKIKTGHIKQMVVLTARTKNILNTLPFIEHYMKFIKEIVFCCPEKTKKILQKEYKGKLKTKFITDEELIKNEKLPEDHQERNFFLRTLIMKNDKIDKEFIMTDDDYRPLVNVDEDFFIKNNKYNAYYYYDTTKWSGKIGNFTSYDLGQFKIRDFLLKNNLPTLSYSSHQMQVINKEIFNEMVNKYTYEEMKGLDEWSTYFNYLTKYYPKNINILPYEVINWPGTIDNWDMYVKPNKYTFENYYEQLYLKDRMYKNLSTTFTKNQDEENQEKIKRFEDSIKYYEKSKKILTDTIEKHENKYREYPNFLIEVKKDKTNIYLPSLITVRNNSFIKIPFTIVFDKDLKNKKITIKSYLQVKHKKIELNKYNNDLLQIDENINFYPYKINIKLDKKKMMKKDLKLIIKTIDEKGIESLSTMILKVVR